MMRKIVLPVATRTLLDFKKTTPSIEELHPLQWCSVILIGQAVKSTLPNSKVDISNQLKDDLMQQYWKFYHDVKQQQPDWQLDLGEAFTQALALVENDTCLSICESYDISLVDLKDQELALKEASHPTRGWDNSFSNSYLNRDMAPPERINRNLERMLDEANDPQKSMPRELSNILKNTTNEQHRFFNRFFANPDEQQHVDWRAGGGKSMATSVLARCRPETTLILSTYGVDQSRFPLIPRSNVVTFGSYARNLFLRKTSLFPNLKNRLSRYNDNLPGIALIQKKFAYPQLGKLSGYQVTQKIQSSLWTFCQSADDEISAKHISKDTNCQTHIAYMVKAVKEYWSELCVSKDKTIQLPVEYHHLIKKAVLERFDIAADHRSPINLILVDEMHDLPDVLVKWLSRSKVPTVSFGDRYQSHANIERNFRGTAPAPSWRSMEIPSSYRIGRGTQHIVQRLMNMNPYGNDHFEGVKSKNNHPIVFSGLEPLEMVNNSLYVVVDSFWQLTKYLRIAVRNNATFAIHTPLLASFTRYIMARLNQLEKFGITDRRSIARTQDLVKVYDLSAIDREIVEELVFDQFFSQDFLNALTKQQPDKENKLTLMTTTYAKNYENQNVALMPEMFRSINAMTDIQQTKILNRFYIAATRATHQLWLPSNFDDFIL